MRRGKPGKWWVLAQTDGARRPAAIFWTGEWSPSPLPLPEFSASGAGMIPLFTTRPCEALQFDSQSSALFAQCVFSLPWNVVPVEAEFADSRQPESPGEPA